jgi:predicted esterase
MKRKIILLPGIYLLLSIICYGQINPEHTYEELRERALNYFPDKADSTIIIMEYAFEKFPDEYLNATTILAQVYTRIGELTKATDIWKAGIQKGYAYGLNNTIYHQYFKDNSEFKILLEEEDKLLSTLHMKHEVLLPKSYNKNTTYPILFIFHGNSRNIVKSKTNWNSPLMSEEFITVFLQSYMPSSGEDFRWVTNDDKTRKEFKDIYDKILNEYSVDNSKIVFAGMSAGGWIALEFMMNNYFPVSGMVLNCPVIPTDINDDMIKGFVERKTRMGIITGENDFALESQKELINKITELNGQAIIEVNKGLGHNFSEDFSEQLEKNLKWVIK